MVKHDEKPRTKIYGFVDATYYVDMMDRKCSICGNTITHRRVDMPANAVEEFEREFPVIPIDKDCFGGASVCEKCTSTYDIEQVWTSISNYTGD